MPVSQETSRSAPLSIPPLADASFEIAGEVRMRYADVTMSGNVDSNNTREVSTRLSVLASELERHAITEVRVDARRLFFVSSSGLKLFVSWITTMAEQPREKQYRIVFVISDKLGWQRRSFTAIASLEPMLVRVEAGDPA